MGTKTILRKQEVPYTVGQNEVVSASVPK